MDITIGLLIFLLKFFLSSENIKRRAWNIVYLDC
jgi:hypothetical protein